MEEAKNEAAGAGGEDNPMSAILGDMSMVYRVSTRLWDCSSNETHSSMNTL